jgi:flavin reductase (DIM6/NTAB) family NADH-FMN oxidoreductase RutF
MLEWGVGRRRTLQPRSDFGRFLDRRLAQLGLSPAQFAHRAELSLSHVYQLLRGDRADPRGTTLRKVAAALGLSQGELALALDAADEPPAEPAVDRATFFALMSAFPTGVTIVSTLDERGRPRGLTCTATCSLSADPPLLLVCIDKRSGTLPALRRTRRFVVNYLCAGRGQLANRFATRGPDKWQGVAWRPTKHGLPWLHADSLAHVECRVTNEVDGGDHVIIVGLAEGGQPPAPGTPPLTYFRRSYVALSGRP